MDHLGRRLLRTLLEHAKFSQNCLVEEGIWEGNEDEDLFKEISSYLGDLPEVTKPLNKPPVLKNGVPEEFTLKVAGKRFFCSCGCNVFHKPDNKNLELYRCNCCETEFLAN